MKLSAKEKHIFLKGVEELNELAVELLQSVNKTNKDNWTNICNEISDVEKWISKIKKMKQ